MTEAGSVCSSPSPNLAKSGPFAQAIRQLATGDSDRVKGETTWRQSESSATLPPPWRWRARTQGDASCNPEKREACCRPCSACFCAHRCAHSREAPLQDLPPLSQPFPTACGQPGRGRQCFPGASLGAVHRLQPKALLLGDTRGTPGPDHPPTRKRSGGGFVGYSAPARRSSLTVGRKGPSQGS